MFDFLTSKSVIEPTTIGSIADYSSIWRYPKHFENLFSLNILLKYFVYMLNW